MAEVIADVYSRMDMHNETVNTTESEETAGLISPIFLFSISLVQALICVTGLGGNILVFYVVCRFSAMHTVTNIFILALALSDIAFLVNVPLLITTSILGDWPFGNFYCKIYYSVTTINQFASSFFLVIMSADRFCAVCHPVWSRKMRTTKTAVLMCTIVWTIAIGLMCPVFIFSGEVSNNDGNTTGHHCNIDWPAADVWPGSGVVYVNGETIFALYCLILGYGLPVTLMVTFYGLVLHRLRTSHAKVVLATFQQTSTTGEESASNHRRRLRLRRVTMMIFVVIIVYLLCWTPYWVLQMYIVFFASDNEDNPIIIVICVSLQCLCFANSTINPVLYAVLSDNFKKSYARAFKRTFTTLTTRSSTKAKNPLLVIQGASTVRELSALNSLTHSFVTTSHLPQNEQIRILLQADVLFNVGKGLLVLL